MPTIKVPCTPTVKKWFKHHYPKGYKSKLSTVFDKSMVLALMRNLKLGWDERDISKEKYSDKLEIDVKDFHFFKLGACNVSAFTIIYIDDLVMDQIKRDIKRDAKLFRGLKDDFNAINKNRKRTKEDTNHIFRLKKVSENVLLQNGLDVEDIKPETLAKIIVRSKNDK